MTGSRPTHVPYDTPLEKTKDAYRYYCTWLLQYSTGQISRVPDAFKDSRLQHVNAKPRQPNQVKTNTGIFSKRRRNFWNF